MDSAAVSHGDPMYKGNKSAAVSHGDPSINSIMDSAAVSHGDPMYKGNKSAAVSHGDPMYKGNKSAAVSHGDPMYKGNKSAAVANEEKVPVSFRKRKFVTDDEKVRKNYIPPRFRKSEKVRKNLSLRKSENVRKSYIPLSFYTTTVYHPSPIMTKVNKSIRNYTVGSDAAGLMDMGNNTAVGGPMDMGNNTAVGGPMDMGNNTAVEGPMDMGNKASESKVSSRNSIPDKVALSILSKLSIKSLKRFGCASKQWSILFENPDFMTMYSNHFISRHGAADDGYHTFLFTNHVIYHAGSDDHDVPNFTKHACLYNYKGKLHLPNNRVKLNVPSPFQQTYFNICILGSTSVNGIFCFGQNSRSVNTVKYVLSNPATDEFLVIPPSLTDLKPPYPQNRFHLLVDFHGFGYDQVRDDFKVIQHVSFHHDDCQSKRFLEIYSLKSNSWRMIHVEFDLLHWGFPPSFNGCELYLDGACHWLAQKFCFNKNHVEITLVSFDMSDEVFLTTPIGEESYSPYTYFRRLAVLNGSIALISNYDDDIIFHISILGELGVTESWTKLYICGPIPSISWPPIGFGKTGYIFFKNKDDELAYVDLSTQIIEEVIEEVGGIAGEKGTYMVGLYKESLLSIGGIK